MSGSSASSGLPPADCGVTIKLQDQSIGEWTIVEDLSGRPRRAAQARETQQGREQHRDLDIVDRQPETTVQAVAEVQVLDSAVNPERARIDKGVGIEHRREYAQHH